jgi:SAM-dependent methyltransferase
MSDALACRFCGAAPLESFLDLGSTPLANSYLTKEQLAQPEPRYPLQARLCPRCLLVQVPAVVPAEAIFGDYAYFSSYAASWVEHAARYAAMARARFALGPQSQVVEVASNDGYLLRHFVETGISVLGIEPAANVAAAAIQIGVPTEVAFFGRATAERLLQRGFAADLLAANNVLAHVPDINDFVAGLALLLKPAGVLTVEFPHLLRLMREVQFDTIYHEHYCYFSLLAVEKIFAAHGLSLFDVEELSTHGGSLRLYGRRSDGAARAEGAGLARVRALEAAEGMDKLASYRGFQPRVETIKRALLAFLQAAKRDGKQVVAYGAAAKGNTLLNFCGIGPELIAYVADFNPHKQGKYLPGSHIPIVAPDRIVETKPDYVLILPWNLEAEIRRQMADVARWGGRFVTAIPEIHVLEARSA